MKKILLFLSVCFLITFPAMAHEAWLLSPEEVIALNKMPSPSAFSLSNMISILLAIVMVLIFLGGSIIHMKWVEPIENKIIHEYFPLFKEYIPIIARICLGFTLLYAGTGILVRHGSGMPGMPTLFVPDLDLRLAGDFWQFIGKIEVTLAFMFFFGIFVRTAAGTVIALAVLGSMLFGSQMMMPYSAHFMMPALFLLCHGGGVFYTIDLKLPHKLETIRSEIARCDKHLIYKVILFGTGMNFAFLGLTYKFLQPNLLMAILEKSSFPTFGIEVQYLAFIMALVEVFAGFAIAVGILVRPLCIFLIGAMCLFAVLLGESLVMHGNVFALMFIGLCYGNSTYVEFDTDEDDLEDDDEAAPCFFDDDEPEAYAA